MEERKNRSWRQTLFLWLLCFQRRRPQPCVPDPLLTRHCSPRLLPCAHVSFLFFSHTHSSSSFCLGKNRFAALLACCLHQTVPGDPLKGRRNAGAPLSTSRWGLTTSLASRLADESPPAGACLPKENRRKARTAASLARPGWPFPLRGPGLRRPSPSRCPPACLPALLACLLCLLACPLHGLGRLLGPVKRARIARCRGTHRACERRAFPLLVVFLRSRWGVSPRDRGLWEDMPCRSSTTSPRRTAHAARSPGERARVQRTTPPRARSRRILVGRSALPG